MKDVEDLIIYKQYLELIYYVETITEKYPKSVKLSLVTEIKNNTYEGIKNILIAYKEYDIKNKLASLNRFDVNLKMQKILIRVSYKKKYISIKNYYAWSKKLSNIENLLGGWIDKCQKQ